MYVCIYLYLGKNKMEGQKDPLQNWFYRNQLVVFCTKFVLTPALKMFTNAAVSKRACKHLTYTDQRVSIFLNLPLYNCQFLIVNCKLADIV